MGMFDRFFKRDDDEKTRGPLSNSSVPMKDFLKFQEEMRKNFTSLRGQFSEVVKENEQLKKQVHQFGNRLDEIQREQLKMGQETRNEIGKIMNIAEKVSSGMNRTKISDSIQEARATHAQNAVTSIAGRLSTPMESSDSKLKPG